MIFSIRGLFPKPSLVALAAIATLGGSLVTVPAAIANESETIDGTFSSLIADLDQQDNIGQVTSVSQLSDVQPTDWAFQALQSLVERYGCIAGYPDGTFRGNRSATRYEMAAALNACLDNISDKFATKEDLEALKALQEEFQAELATLRGRVDGLEARTDTLEAQQFSTTTKLSGEAIFGVGYTFDENTATASGPEDEDSDRVFFANRVRLNFNTSFNGEDLLRVRLQARNVPELQDSTGTRMARLGFDGDEENTFELNELFYQFKLGDFKVKIDANAGEFQDNFDTVNPFLSSSGGGALSRFARFNPIYRQGSDGGGSAGATVSYDIGEKVNLAVGYLAEEAQSPVSAVGDDPAPADDEPRGGLFNGSYAAMAQITVEPFKRSKFALTYAKAFDEAGNVNLTASTGGSSANPFTGNNTRRPFGNGVDTESDHLAFQASIQPADFVNLSGWVGYTFANTATAGDGIKAELINWNASAQFPDLFGKGNLGYLSFGQPFRIVNADGQDFNGPADGTGEISTSYHAEAGYKFAVSKNISITPGVIWIINPEHNSANTDTVVGLVRTTFRF